MMPLTMSRFEFDTRHNNSLDTGYITEVPLESPAFHNFVFLFILRRLEFFLFAAILWPLPSSVKDESKPGTSLSDVTIDALVVNVAFCDTR